MQPTRAIPGVTLPLLLLVIAACSEDKPAPEPRPVPERKEVVEPKPELPHEYFPTALAAIEKILAETEPRVVGFGEFHQKRGTEAYLSTLQRFSEALLPVLAQRTSDLIVEAWVSTGKCGETEKQTVAEVEQISDRPAATENENIVLLKRARSLGVKPHILEMSCDDYKVVHGGDAGVDYVAMLELVARRLEQKSLAVIGKRPAGDPKKLIALFTGAIHNDVAPAEDWKTFAIGPALARAAGGKYVEVDLFVPEFVLGSDSARHESWYPLVERLASPDRATLIRRGERSYIVVMRKGVQNPPATAKGAEQ
jgi:hypothetical protein